jgi:hypothetical protein
LALGPYPGFAGSQDRRAKGLANRIFLVRVFERTRKLVWPVLVVRHWPVEVGRHGLSSPETGGTHAKGHGNRATTAAIG